MKTKSILLLAAIACVTFVAKAQNAVIGGNNFGSGFMTLGNTGLGSFGLLAGDATRMFISGGSGNIGINNTNPAYLLDISGGDLNINSTNGYRLGGNMILSSNNVTTNIFLGVYAGSNTTSASSDNAFLGYAAGYDNTSGSYNTACGVYSLYANTTGNCNTSTGYFTLVRSNGSYNTANGYGALYLNNANGSYNVAVGSQALYGNTSGNNNSAVGNEASYSNTTGASNAALGNSALYSNNTGAYNAALGADALYKNTASNNTACGYQALYSNTSGTSNVATGFVAGLSNTTGGYNTIYGAYTLYNNTTGSSNVAIGYQASFNSNGSYNTSTGYDALYGSSLGTGSYNTADGLDALSSNTSGSQNTAVGGYALSNNSGGINNTGIGYESGPASDSVDNTTAVGYDAIPTAGNEIVLGNAAITKIGAYVSGISNLSDGRFKKNIKEDVHGLDFIMKLKPVTYNLDVTKLNTFLGADNSKAENGLTDKQKATIASINEKAIKAKEAVKTSGFIAQDVEQAAKEVNYDFDGVSVPANTKDHYSLVYDEFVVPLVKGMQEQQAEISKQQADIDSLKKMVCALVNNHPNTTLLTPGSDGLTNTDVTLSNQNVVVLNQNAPNPFSEQTVITYTIPQGSGQAQILFFGSTGQLIKAVNISANGPGQLTVYASDLNDGIYTYSLLIDGKTLETKRMIKGK